MKLQGVFLNAQARSKHLPIKSMPMQEYYYLPIPQEGTSVNPGDILEQGQIVVPDSQSNVLQHSPVNGIFEEIQNFYGQDYMVIHAFPNQIEKIYLLQDPFTKDPNILIDEVRKAGIIGMGGAGFPSHLKLKNSKNKVHTLLINCVESEPFLSGDIVLMFEHAMEIIQGARVIKYIIGAHYVEIAIYKNPELRKHLESYLDETIKIVEFDHIYPMGCDRLIVYAVSGIELTPQQLSIDIGYVTFNVSTIFAIYEALFYNKPLIERILTVDGALSYEFGNFRVLLGTPISSFMRPFADLDAGIIFEGGPMMGKRLDDVKSTNKTMNSILIFEGTIDKEESSCIRCAECVDHCPMKLEPFRLINMVRHEEIDLSIENGLWSCIGCNVCSYICPSYIPLGTTIFEAKKNCFVKK